MKGFRAEVKNFRKGKRGIMIGMLCALILGACGGNIGTSNGGEGGTASAIGGAENSGVEVGRGTEEGGGAAEGGAARGGAEEGGAARDGAAEGGATGSSATEGGAMGRYVETAVTLPAVQSHLYFNVAQREQEIWISEQQGQDLLSQDGGISFALAENVPTAFQEAIEKEAYFSNIAVTPNGQRLCNLFEVNTKNDSYEHKLYLYRPHEEAMDFPSVPVGISTEMTYAPDGYFYLADGLEDSNGIYRIDPEGGEAKLLLRTEDTAEEIMVDGKHLFVIMDQKVVIYDLATLEEEEEDPLLSSSLGLPFDDMISETGATAVMMPDPKQEGIYFVNASGLFYHVLHGSVMEQLIDGTLCSIGDAEKNFVGLTGIWVGEVPEFTVVFSDGTVMRYSYEAGVLSVPSQSLRIYSLYEDANVNQAVSGFRMKHPELQVLYEIGIEGNSGVTKENALSSLTMEIAAGEGPDVIVMDDIPFTSFAEKGVFADLSGVWEKLSGEAFFDQIADTYVQDGKQLGIPAVFYLPLFVTKDWGLQQMTSLLELADAAEAARAAQPKGSICNIQDAAYALSMLSVSSQGEWMTQDNRLNTDAIRQFLTQVKRIYDAQTAGVSLPNAVDYGDTPPNVIRTYTQTLSYYNVLVDLREDCAWAAGLLDGGQQSFSAFWSALEQQDASYILMPGQSYGVCSGASLLTLNQGSANLEYGKEFITYMVSAEFQSSAQLRGFGINRTAFHEQQVMPTKIKSLDEPINSMGMSGISPITGEDINIHLDVYWPNEEAFEKLENTILQAKAGSICDPRVTDTVIEVGSNMLLTGQSVDEAVKEIEKETNLMLSE
jgi:ABC-type glycerol-3-phosphate transport system substrate-binding protein